MIAGKNNNLFKIDRTPETILVAVLFSIILIFGTTTIGLTNPPLPQQRQVYAQEIEDCFDGFDNDGDNAVDSEDTDCITSIPAAPSSAEGEGGAVSQAEICDDGADNDEDNLVDFEDLDCITPPADSVSPTPREEPLPPPPTEQPLVDEFGNVIPTEPIPSENVTAIDNFTAEPEQQQEQPFPTPPGEEPSPTLTPDVSPTPEVTPSPPPTPTEIVFVLVCADGTPANADGTCTDGSQPLTISTEELVCDDGNHPDANVMCTDGSHPKFVSSGGEQVPADSVSPSPTPEAMPAGGVSTCNPSAATLSRSAKGPEVTSLQNILIQLGYNVGPTGADGDFGGNTETAVKQFQQDNGLTANGVVDANTWSVLCSSSFTTPTAPVTPAGPTASNNLDSIHNPDASTLDQLPQGLGGQYKSFNWDYYDYPGLSKGDPGNGPNEQKAKEMFAALANIKPERRPNTGATAILTKDKVTQDLWNYVQNEMVPVLGQSPHKLNRYAAESFTQMQAAAKNDGVDLVILDSDRSPQQSQASAKKSGNPFAVASFSSHNLGLAIDFKMSQGNQMYSETTTRPMKNIVNMMQSPVHKWLFQNGANYGWYPWNYEPWHWEYNPPDLRGKFYANCNCDPMP